MVSEPVVVSPVDVVLSVDETAKAVELIDELVCPFSLKVLKIIKEFQNLHGLKHDDYQRYRQYCTRRLQRMYKGLKFTHGSKKFQNKKITQEFLVKDIRYLQIILVRAERAWAYAMDLKQFANTESRKQVHLKAKLKKAVQYAEELEAQCVLLKCDTSTQLEAKAYCLYMKGMLQFEQGTWQVALQSFTGSRQIYEKLSHVVEEEDTILYTQRHEEMGPKVQYCVYNLKSGDKVVEQGGDTLLNELDDLIAEKAAKTTDTVAEISWERKTVVVKNDELKILLTQIEGQCTEAKECESLDKKLSLYEDVLVKCRDAAQLFKEAEKAKGAGSKVQQGEVEVMTDYLLYLRLCKTIDRFLVMAEQVVEKLRVEPEQRVGKSAKPEDLVRLYDIILQNYADMRDISSLEEGGVINKSIDFYTQFYRTKRCYYIAEFHLSVKKWENAIVLYDRCSDHSATTEEQISELAEGGAGIRKELEELNQMIYSQRCSAHASAFLQTQLVTEEMKSLTNKDKLLGDRLEEFNITTDIPKLAQLPPDFQHIPCKPLFFDISLNHIDFPDLEERVEKESGGVTGFVKSWLWGK